MKQKSHWYGVIKFNEINCVICLGDFSVSTGKSAVISKFIPSFNGDILLHDHHERQNKQKPVGRVLVHPKYSRVHVDPKRAKPSSNSSSSKEI